MVSPPLSRKIHSPAAAYGLPSGHRHGRYRRYGTKLPAGGGYGKSFLLADVKFRHVSDGQSAAKQENPLYSVHNRGGKEGRNYACINQKRAEVMEKVSYFSFSNLKGALISLTFGALIYCLIVGEGADCRASQRKRR